MSYQLLQIVSKVTAHVTPGHVEVSQSMTNVTGRSGQQLPLPAPLNMIGILSLVGEKQE